jgi:VWFA-related protein
MNKKTIGLLLLTGSFPVWTGSLGVRQSQDRKIPRHDAAAVVKLIPVRVLGPDGKPVADLRREDFTVTDNGERKTISEFEVHALATGPVEIETLAPTAIRETGRKFFIVLDIQSSDPDGLTNAKKAALHFVQTQMRPGDQASVLYYGPMTGLNLAQYLTADKALIKKGIERAKEAPPSAGFSSGGEVAAAEGEALADRAKREAAGARGMETAEAATGGAGSAITAGGASPVGGEGVLAVPGMSVFSPNERDFKTNMSELAKAFQVIPGAKNVIFFSARNAGRDIGREFAAVNIPVFAVNTRNWITQGVLNLSVKTKHLFAEHPLKELALASGGRYFADIEDVKTIAAEIQALTGTYYVLGYYITENWDGRFHQIKVEVRRPGVRVLAGEGYYEAKPFAELSDMEKKLHLFDLTFSEHPAAAGAVEIPAEALYAPDGKNANSVFLARLPVDERKGVPPAGVEIYAYVFDKDRKAVRSLKGDVDLSKKAEAMLYPYFTAALPPGEYECRLVARDKATGQAAFASAALRIPAPQTAAMSFFSPLLLVPSQEPQFLRMAAAKGVDRPATLIDLYPLLPVGCSPLLKVLPAGARRLLAVWPVRHQGAAMPDVDFDARLTRPDGGEDLAAEVRIADVKSYPPDRVVLLLEIALPELQPGSYSLEILAGEPGSTAPHVAAAAFKKY